MASKQKYRLVTRSDFDGLVCAVLLKKLDLIDDITFVHPKDMQDGVIAISERDITTNLPFVDHVHLAFDHHLSEAVRIGEKENYVIDPRAPSAARVVFDYYGGVAAFGRGFDAMMTAVDQADSAQFSKDEILHPSGWPLLNFIMDARTGLGRFREFRVSNYQLMMDLIDYCRDHRVDQILNLPDVKERVDLYFEQAEPYQQQIRRCGRVHKNLLVIDLRAEPTIFVGNRFMPYALYPEVNISIHVLWGVRRQNTVLAIGKSIFDRSSNTNIGLLALRYGGGGHEAAGTCQVDNDQADAILAELIATITLEG